ncbi:hypothetical protein [Enterobacter cloacae]|uniref:hypothetical protein n=1 Tax=Enterobacter cloacae TaxID=550 RepID=UPI001F5D0613|nr:hypothetical protein [Enterobacter cloacae]
MSTITKEQLRERAREKVKSLEFSITQTAFADSRAELEEELELARIALASLEAEPVGLRDERSGSGGICKQSGFNELPHGTPLYTAPPAPSNAEPVAWVWSHRKHPSEVTLVRPEDDQKAEAAQWSGWSYKPLYAEPPVAVSVPDYLEQFAEFMAAESIKSGNYPDGWQCKASNAAHEYAQNVLAAMPQGADSPDYRAIVERISEIVHGKVTDIGLLTITVKSMKDKLHDKLGNSPLIPDGWVMVPVEPTEDMLVNGFESEPDESFSDEKEWEEYEAMSGCQQAAHRAKLCWSAMLTAAPKPEA